MVGSTLSDGERRRMTVSTDRFDESEPTIFFSVLGHHWDAQQLEATCHSLTSDFPTNKTGRRANFGTVLSQHASEVVSSTWPQFAEWSALFGTFKWVLPTIPCMANKTRKYIELVSHYQLRDCSLWSWRSTVVRHGSRYGEQTRNFRL